MKKANCCSQCRYFTDFTQMIFRTDYGDTVVAEQGVCSYNNRVVLPMSECQVDWEQEDRIRQWIAENDRPLGIPSSWDE